MSFWYGARQSVIPTPRLSSLSIVGLLSLLLLGTAGPLAAESNTTNLFDGTTTNFGGAYSLPSSSPGTNNYLIILHGGAVTNTTGTIGSGSSDNANTAIVDGTGSLWENSSTLLVGNAGSFNQLIVTNGGRVDSAVGLVALSGNNNLAIITGTGSLWNMSSYFQVGDSGKNNQLTIADGGLVSNVQGYIGSIGSTNATVLVTDAGSAWNNSDVLYAGYAGVAGRLIISNGGLVSSYAGQIGYYNTSASNNTVLVTGANSFWTNTLYLNVGTVSSGNQLTIADGGRVLDTVGTIGSTATAGNNLVTVTGAGAAWTNSSSVMVGSSGSNNRLVITNGGRVDSTYAYLGYNDGSDNNSVLIDGSNSLWNTTQYIDFGTYGGDNNRLTIANGGRLVTPSGGYIGDSASSSNNAMIITGANSLWTNSSATYVGYSSYANQLILTNGGRLFSVAGYIGWTSFGSNNTVAVSGAGSQWTDQGELRVGSSGGHSQLTIADGGRVDTALQGNIGFYSDSNSVLLTDTGSVWNLSSWFQVGIYGRDNQIVVTNGARLNSTDGYLGGANTSSNNLLVVTGPGTVMSNSGTLYVGNAGPSNTAVFADGAQVFSFQGIIGYLWNTNAGWLANNNRIVVTDSNTTWNIRITPGYNSLSIGYQGAGNELTVTNGGLVSNGAFRLGDISVTSSNNTLIVTGPGSLLTNTDSLTSYVGLTGGGNQVIVEDGGRIDTYHVTVGYNASSGNNSILVTGSNSLWNSRGAFFVIGSDGSNNRLTVTNGGRVADQQGYLNSSTSAAGTNDSALVTGAGSVWSNRDTLTIGGNGWGNQLTIANSGRVDSTYSYIGDAATSSNNIVTVASGGVWNNLGNLAVGHRGADNQLIIASGGQVIDVEGYIGGGNFLSASDASMSNNLVTVTGAGSVWTNSLDLHLGFTLAALPLPGSNQLLIANGGRVEARFVNIGEKTDNNTITVSGTGSVLNVNGTFLSVGGDGSNNRLIITNGAHVIHGASTAETLVGGASSSTNNLVVVTGVGSLLQIAPTGFLYVGSNGVYNSGSGSVLLLDGGTLDTTEFLTGYNGAGTISNRAGVFQFPTAAPIIVTNTANSIVMTNGTISYRDVAGANIYNPQVARIVFQGNNAFQLNGSSNATGLASYTFDSAANTGTPTNYQRLALVNPASTWQSATLAIGSGGELLVSNSTATIAATLYATGSVRVVNSTVRYLSNVVINGSYRSDPSTNTYLANVTVNPSGTLAGSPGDLFDFMKNFLVHSTNATGFNLAASAVTFSGGGTHTNAITGANLGANVAAFGAAFETQTNFAYGEFHLGSLTDQVCFTCGVLPAPATTNNALYIGWLDLLGDTNLVANLHADSGITLYYNQGDARNAYLGDLTYQLTNCGLAPGGGFLMPVIPEPSAMAFLAMAGLLILRRAQRRR